MRRIRRSWFLVTVCLIIVLVLSAGCFREVTEDLAPTPGAEGEQGTPSDEEVIATALAEATFAATAQVAGEPTLLIPTRVPPTAIAEEPSPAPQPTAVVIPTQPAPTQPAPTSPPPPTAEVGSGVHVVQAGENLFRIALRYGTTVDALMAANNLTSQTIYVGQKLVIPGSGAQPEPPASGGTTYVVKAGDNLYRIALSFGLSYQQLAQYNGITDPNSIYAGQVLRIPPR
jgi:LysM repeat protein